MRVTQRSFQFGKKYNLPQYFVSAANGTNVVKVRIKWLFNEMKLIMLICFDYFSTCELLTDVSLTVLLVLYIPNSD